MERTLIILKPDAVNQNLIGEIIRRYENIGLKVVALKMMKPSRALLEKHYPDDKEFLISLGKKAEQSGVNVKDYLEAGKQIREWLINFMSNKVVAMILESKNAVEKARKITGYTDPSKAEKGTIRGDLSNDSIEKAMKEKRVVHNLVHASGNKNEAEKEITLWFGKQ